MKYKEGDRVLIKSLDWYNKNKDEVGNIRYKKDGSAYPVFFSKYMSNFCGEILTIKSVFKNSYHMNETSSCEFWTDEMIEGLVDEIEITQDTKRFSEGYEQGYEDGQHDMNEWILPEGFEFHDENGNIINATKIVLEKKKKEYPKTYEECCVALEYIPHTDDVIGYKWNILQLLQKLLICRDAYWKIAGEKIGLGKPWEPDWEDESDKFTIGYFYNGIDTNIIRNYESHPLAFPTKEMRDAFYENFKDLIDKCKELL